jgi:hypothetical protein
VIPVVDLSRFTVFFGRHSRLEKRDRRAIEVEFSCNADFDFLGFVGEPFFELLGLAISVVAAVDWFGRGDVSVGVFFNLSHHIFASLFKSQLIRRLLTFLVVLKVWVFIVWTF